MWSALKRFEDLSRRAWFGDALWLALCVAITALALWMRPSVEAVSLFGFDVPVLCTFRRFTGMSCPGCGLTRSFVFLAHGQLSLAFQMNPLGPIAFAWVVAQIPWRMVRLSRYHSRIRTKSP